MNTIGLIGGMSWESTATYYNELNRAVSHRLGGLHSAKIQLISLNFAEIAHLQKQGNWYEAGIILSDAAQKLEQAGVDCVAICTNTMHKVADQVQKNISVPLIHIIDTAAKALQQKQVRKVALLGTQFTMEHDFYKNKLAEYQIELITPSAKERVEVHRIIFEELCLGRVLPQSKATYLAIIDNMANIGAEAVLLACTEINLLIQQDGVSLPVFDTTMLHVEALLDYSLGGNKESLGDNKEVARE
ncbi:aspartate/glutamate racemase family protein [Marinomonas agarivorans]|nr:aspartate/glutamate racemase family protein [Marinomonas agarivorans]